MAGLSTGAPIVQVYHEKSTILPDVSRVLACLYEKDIKFTTHTASYKSLLRLQASTHAPVPFYDGPTFLEESREICRYIAEKYEHHGYPFLLGKDALERASIEQWLHNEEHAFNPLSRALFCHLAFPLNEEDDGDEVDMHTRKLEEVLEVYEQRLSDSEFLAGNKFTLADLVHLPNSHYITVSDKFLYLYDSRKNVRRWWDTISTRDSWQQVLKDMKRVEEQNKQEELKKQQEQEQEQKDHPRTTGQPIRIYYQKPTSIEPRTILVPPTGTMSSSPIVPQTEKPLPTDIPDEALASSSQRKTTDSKLVSTPDGHGHISEAAKARHDQPAVHEDDHDANSPIHDVDKYTIRGTQVADSTSSVAKPMYTELPALTPSRRAEIEHAGDKSRESSKTIPERQKMVERNTSTSGEQSSGRLKVTPPSREAAAEDVHDANGDMIKSPDIVDTTKKSGGTFEEAKDLGFTLPEAQSLGAQDAQRTSGGSTTPTANQWKDLSTRPQSGVQDDFQKSKLSAIDRDGLGSLSSEGKDAEAKVTEEKSFSTEPLKEMLKISESKTPKAQPTDSQGSTGEEKTSSVYKKKPLVAQDSQEQAQTMPTGEKADDSTPKHQQAFYVPYTSDDKLSASAPPRAKIHDSHSAEEPNRKDTANDQKLVPPLLSKELASQVHYPSEPSRDAVDHGDLSAKPSIIDQWQRTSAALNDVSYSSGDNEMAMSTIDWKPTPMSQQETLGAEGANQLAKESGEQREEPPVPIVAETPDVQSASPSLPGASIVDNATTNDKFAKQSIIGEPIQMQAPSTKIATPEGHVIGDSELVSTPDGQTLEAAKGRHDPAIVHEDVHDANLLAHDVVKDSFKGMKAADSTPPSVKPMYTQQPALTPSEQAEVEAAKGNGRQSSKSIPEQQKMVERETVTSGGQLPDHLKTVHPSGQAAAEDTDGATGDMIVSPDILDDTKKSRDTSEETTGPVSTLPKAQSFGSQDAQRTMLKESESTMPEAQPSDSQGPIKEDKTSSIYQKRLLAAQDSREQAQIIPAGENVDDSTLKHQQASDAPYSLDEKFSASTFSRADIRDDRPAQESYRKDTTDGQKVAPPLLSQKPTSQVQPPSEPSQYAAPNGDLFRKPSTIDQWQRASALLKGVNTDSDDNEMAMSNIDQKPMPTSQEAPLSSQTANQMAQQSGEKTVEPPVPVGTETSDVQRAALSVPEAATADHAIIDDKFAKKSIMDGRVGEPKQMQAPIADVRPVSEPTKRTTPDGHETGDLETAKATKGPATIHEYSLDLAIDEKIATHNASGDQLVTGSLHEQARPPASTQETTEPIGGQMAKEPQLGGTLPAEVAQAEHKSTPSDQETAHAAQPLPPVEPVNTDSNFSAADYTIAPQVSWQQSRPSAPITRGVPASDSQSVIRKIQEVSPDDHGTDDSGKPLAPSQEQISHASQTIPRREDMASSPSERDSPKSDIQLSSAHVHEVTPDESSEKQGSRVGSAFGTDDLGPAEKKIAASGQDSVHSKSPPSAEQTNEEVGDSAPETRQISSTRLRKGDAAVAAPDQAKDLRTTSGRQGILPAPVDLVSPAADTQDPSSKDHEDVPADDFGEAKPSVSASAPYIQHHITPDEVAPPEQRFVLSEPTSSTKPRKKEIRDSAPSTQLISSTETRKEDAVIPAPDQDKDLQTTLDQQDIPSAPVRPASPSSDTQRPSEKALEDAPPDDLGEASSKPSALVREVRPPTAVPSPAPETQLDAARDEAALDKQIFLPPGQDSINSTEPPSSREKRNGDDGDSAPSRQWISSTRPRKGDAVASAPDQDKDSQMNLGQQDILPPVTSASPSSDNQRPSGKVHEDVPADAFGEAKPIVQASAPDTQDETAPVQAAPDEQKFAPSEPTSSTERRKKEIRGSAPSTQTISSTETRKEDSVIPAPDQDKDLQTTLNQQDIPSAPVRPASPSSDTQRPSEKALEDAPPDDLGEASSKPSALVREVRPPTAVPSPAPETQHDAARDEEALDKQIFLPPGQDSVNSTQPPSSREKRNGDDGDSAHSRQWISSTRPRKGDAVASAPDQDKDSQMNLGQQDILPPVKSASPSSDNQRPSGTQDASSKIQDSTSDGIDTDVSLPRKEQVSLGRRDSDRREEQTTEPYRTIVDEKTTTSPSSKAYSSDPGSDLTPTRTEIRPSIGEGPTVSSFPEHGSQTQPPSATQDISLDALSKAKSAGQGAKAPIASASDAESGVTQPQDEAAPVEQNFAISDQESVHASKSSFTAESGNGKANAGPADQMNVRQTIFGSQAPRQTPDAREDLSKYQESSRDDDHISNLANPLVSQEQAFHTDRASEGPTSEVHSIASDKKTTLPSDQAQTSNTQPDSTLITGDAHLSSANLQATSTLQNQAAQPPAATQAPTTQAQQDSASTQKVHADSLENTETPRQPSKDQVVAPVASSAAHSDSPQGEPGTTTVQSPREASFDLSGDEKITTIQGDQVNTLPNGDRSISQVVGPSESTVTKRIYAERKIEGVSTDEKSKAQQQIAQSDTPSSKDNNKEADAAIRLNLSATRREPQKQHSPKEIMESSEESGHQQQADQANFQSPEGKMKQDEETKVRDTETGEPEEREPQDNTNQTNNRASPGKQTSGVQLLGENTKDASNSTDHAPAYIQTLGNSEDSLSSFEESKVQEQPEGKTQDGEPEAPSSETEQPKGRSLPENSYQNNSTQSQAEASDRLAEQSSPGIKNKNKGSGRWDGPTDGTKEDKPQ